MEEMRETLSSIPSDEKWKKNKEVVSLVFDER